MLQKIIFVKNSCMEAIVIKIVVFRMINRKLSKKKIYLYQMAMIL